jgi:DnaJ-class molecular chaperone
VNDGAVERIEDPYVTLGVAISASQQEIARAYRRLAHLSHPDSRPDDPGASARFQALSGAYRILGDPERRARYDRAHTAEKAASRFPYFRDPSGHTTSPVRVGVGSSFDAQESERKPWPTRPPIWAGPVLWKPNDARGNG